MLKFDNEDINEIDRDIAGRFVRQNNNMYKNTPLFGMNQNNDEDFKSEENDGKLKDTFRVGNTIITKEMVVPYKGKVKYSNLSERSKLENKDKGKNKEESDKNKELFEYIKSLGYLIYKHEPTLYNPNNYFHNPENVFVDEAILSDGTKISVNIVSSNVLCIPSEIDAKVDGFPEIS